MTIILENISKRYHYQWILKNFTHTFLYNSKTGISGLNGSGKSTLIKIISGWLSPSQGKIRYELPNKVSIDQSNIYSYISLASPYTHLIENFNLEEMYNFHSKFRQLNSLPNFTTFKKTIDINYQNSKLLKYYSSGMIQRVKLLLAIATNSPILLLDEPTSYLDENGKSWFREMLSKFGANKTIIIASNDTNDFVSCQSIINISDLNQEG